MKQTICVFYKTSMNTQSASDLSLRLPGYSALHTIKSIARLEGNGNYTFVHLDNSSKPLLVCQTLKWFEEQIPDFIRISKSEIINPAWVQDLVKVNTKTVYLRLRNGNFHSVSRRRAAQILDRFQSYN